MVKLGNPKNIFWEALLLTVVVFASGIFLGIAFENSRVEKVNTYYVNAEISLVDILALNNFISSSDASCRGLLVSNLEFADKIYEESKVLDDYDSANKLSDDLKLVHTRYDLLRTLLWVSASEARIKCKGDFSIVVYLYDRETEDLADRASQNVWSKILQQLKEKQGSNIILIPISVGGDLSSLKAMTERYDIANYPVVIINDVVIRDLKTVDELEQYLN